VPLGGAAAAPTTKRKRLKNRVLAAAAAAHNLTCNRRRNFHRTTSSAEDPASSRRSHARNSTQARIVLSTKELRVATQFKTINSESGSGYRDDIGTHANLSKRLGPGRTLTGLDDINI
jgi:hypothetical protein